jgi:hypothetical protein
VRGKARGGEEVGAARVGLVDEELVDHPPRPRRHHHHALRQEHRLADAVRDEHHRALPRRPQLQQAAVEPVARDLVERAEGLVHQQQLRPRDEAACNAHAHLLAAARLARPDVLELLQAQRAQHLAHTRLALGPRHAGQIERQAHLGHHTRPGHPRGLLEHEAQGVTGAFHPLHRLAPQPQPAVGGLQQAGHHLEQRALAAAAGAEQRDEFALGHRQVHRQQGLGAVGMGLLGREHLDGGNRVHAAAAGLTVVRRYISTRCSPAVMGP